MQKLILVIVASVLCPSSSAVAQQNETLQYPVQTKSFPSTDLVETQIDQGQRQQQPSSTTKNRLIVLTPQGQAKKVRKKVEVPTGKIIVLRSPISSDENEAASENSPRRVLQRAEIEVQQFDATPSVAADSELVEQGADKLLNVDRRWDSQSDDISKASLGLYPLDHWATLVSERFWTMIDGSPSQPLPPVTSQAHQAQVPAQNFPSVTTQIVDGGLSKSSTLQPALHFEQTELTVQQPAVSVEQPALKVEQRELTIEQPTLAVEQNGVSITNPQSLTLSQDDASPQMLDSVKSSEFGYSTKSEAVVQEEPAAASTQKSTPTIVSSPDAGLVTPVVAASIAPIAEKTFGVLRDERSPSSATPSQDSQAGLLSQNSDKANSAATSSLASDRAVANPADAPKAQRTTKRKAAGGLWVVFPWLLLPLLGLLFWGAFRTREKKREAATREVAESHLTSRQNLRSSTTVPAHNTHVSGKQKTLKFENSSTDQVAATGEISVGETDAIVASRSDKTEDSTQASEISFYDTTTDVASQPQESAELSDRDVTKQDSITTFASTEVADDLTTNQSSTTSSGIASGTALNGATQAASLSSGQRDSTDQRQKQSDVQETNSESHKSTRESRETMLVSSESRKQSAETTDDFTKIHGIDSATTRLLHDSGITSFHQLEQTSTIRLREILANGGASFKLIDPATWHEQTRYALEDNWSGLSKWQATNGVAADEASGSTRQSQSQSNSDSTKREASRASETTEEATTTATSGKFDDLTKIHGIGPATAKLLRDSGITSFQQLHETGLSGLQSILNAGGSKFALIDPSTWKEQTRFAIAGDWNGLSKWQTNNSTAGAQSTRKDQSSVRQNVAQRATEPVGDQSAHAEDLTKIKGLGKASQKVLNKNEIYRFAQVGSMTPKQLDKIFASMQKRFQLLDTTTWPSQAQELASEGRSRESKNALNLENEILDEIDSIQQITSDETSLSSQQQEQQFVTRE